MTKTTDIQNILDRKFPQESIEDWDKVGFSSFYEKNIQKILISLDLTNEVVDYAINNNFDFILNYHTFLFYKKTLKESFVIDPYKRNIYSKLKKNKISVFSVHTNFDYVANTGSDLIFKSLELAGKRVVSVSQFNAIYELENSIKFSDFVNNFKQKTNLNCLQTNVFKDTYKLKTVAILPGAAGLENMLDVIKNKADLYITSDPKWNELINYNQLKKTNVLFVPHLVEQINLGYFKEILEQQTKGIEIEIFNLKEIIRNV
ncbi:Nif3-like dinuclear metal center hexameric protein [Mycoplasma procyoni]|uniref:Nif3-like dinuclear metal center hexameric protein n=1 Tax=Mycoplasma procyoni TaxID=568784 RepID=UPI00197C2FF0|nr:Nif3-like dinuclear metal center hexameric protein [Mycoplasma procyoni]MBN3534549.1 Nif3-like dinuclear metal center hexameric protein [Mycoplasma procyoni]